MAFIDNLKKQKKDEFILCPGRNVNVPCYEMGVVPGDVGLELEIEGAGLPEYANIANIISTTTKARWNAKPDGSLRGGLEYVTTGAIKTSELRQMVGGLFDRFKELGTRINNSNRCSTHVHVNVSDLKANKITSALALWCTFQTCLIRWCGEERVNNHFCLSSRDEESMPEAWMDYLLNGLQSNRNHRPNVKYTALNIIPIWSQGSLEFRCGAAADEPDKVVYWAKICNAVVRYAAEYFDNPMELAYALSEQGPEVLLRRVLEFAKLGDTTTDRIYRELTADGLLQTDAMNDFRDIQSFLYAIPWEQVLPAINAEYVPNPFETKKVKMGGLPRFAADFVP